MRDKKFFVSSIFSLSLLGFLIFSAVNFNNLNENKVCFKKNCFEVELAQTAGERARGLMFRESLDSDKGMLFIFEEEKNHPFWMKNTLIPLDIIWLSQDKKVAYIKKNALPCPGEYCPLIRPGQKAKYVLEINTSMVEQINLKIGDQMVFK